MSGLRPSPYKHSGTKVHELCANLCRLSPDDQNLDLQRDAAQVAGCARVFEDMVSSTGHFLVSLLPSTHVRGYAHTAVGANQLLIYPAD